MRQICNLWTRLFICIKKISDLLHYPNFFLSKILRKSWYTLTSSCIVNCGTDVVSPFITEMYTWMFQGIAKQLLFPLIPQFTHAFIQTLQVPDGFNSDSGLKMEIVKVVRIFFYSQDFNHFIFLFRKSMECFAVS